MSATARATTGHPRQAATHGSGRSPTRRGTPRNDLVANLLPGWARRTVLGILGLVVGLPVLYILLSSFAPDADVASGRLLPSRLTLHNWIAMWSTVDLARGLGNSLLVCGIVAVVSAFLGLATAYTLVRFTFVGRLTFLRSLVVLQSVPGTLLLLPLFVLFATVKSHFALAVIGTRWGLGVTYLTFALPFATWVLVTYVRGLPEALEEAGRIDGLSRFGVLRHIVFPLSRPGLVVAGIFSFLLGWNDVLFSSVFTLPATRTVAVDLQVFGLSQEGGALPLYGQVMSSAVLCALPVVVLYLVFQRQLVAGLTSGGVK